MASFLPLACLLACFFLSRSVGWWLSQVRGSFSKKRIRAFHFRQVGCAMRLSACVVLLWLPALALGSCDPTWCDCTACAHRPGVRCDLCEGRHVFVLGTGRSGSTTILEALNSLPGVDLSGENHASLEAAEELFRCALAACGRSRPSPSLPVSPSVSPRRTRQTTPHKRTTPSSPSVTLTRPHHSLHPSSRSRARHAACTDEPSG